MTYIGGYSRRMQRAPIVGLRFRLLRGAEISAVFVSFLFLFGLVAGLV